jgi:microcystin degradation protein MlrC
MIVFAGGISHESHSFSNRLTQLQDFAGAESGAIAAQPHLIETRSREGGVLRAASELGWELVFPFFAEATPSGPLTVSTFETLTDRLICALAALEQVDGVLLLLHGAMFAENFGDTEGEILARVRTVVGSMVPIAVALDPHANVTDRMAATADILTSYRTTPHTDMWETSYRAARLLDDAVAGRTRPKVRVARLPMLAGMDMGRTIDPNGPMCQLLSMAREIERDDPDVLDISLNAGFYYGDLLEAGPSVTVTGNGGGQKFAAIAARLMREAWKTRDFVSIRHVKVKEAVAYAAAAARGHGPLILVDYTDGPFGGGHGDGTELLGALLEENIEGTVVGPIFDPSAARASMEAAVGAVVSLSVGGHTDPAYGGGPIELTGKVLSISDGVYIRKGPFSTGTIGHLGPSALVQVGNVAVVLVSHRVQPEDREQYRLFGINPEETNILACKGINHFRADFEPISRELVFVDSGGLVSVDITQFPFRNVRRPIWPLDPNVELPGGGITQ